MASFSNKTVPAEPKVSDIVWRKRKDGRWNKVFLNGKKVVRKEIFDER